MANKITDKEIERIGEAAINEMPGAGMIMIVFDYNSPGTTITVSNVKDEITILALEAAIKKMKNS